MEKGLILTDGKYSRLITDLRKLIDDGRFKAQSAANREYMSTYWRVGQRLAAERLTETAGYGESVMEKLAYELKTDRSTLVRCLQFHRYYPKGAPKGTTLSWSHYRCLLAVKDDKARAFYEKTAEEKEWTQEELARAIHEDLQGQEDQPGGGGKPPKRLVRPKGGPFVYRALCCAQHNARYVVSPVMYCPAPPSDDGFLPGHNIIRTAVRT